MGKWHQSYRPSKYIIILYYIIYFFLKTDAVFWRILANLVQAKRETETQHKSLLSVDATAAAAAAAVNSTLHAALLFMMCQQSCRAPSLLFFCCAAVCAKLLRIRALLTHNIVVSCVLEASTSPPSRLHACLQGESANTVQFCCG